MVDSEKKEFIAARNRAKHAGDVLKRDLEGLVNVLNQKGVSEVCGQSYLSHL